SVPATLLSFLCPSPAPRAPTPPLFPYTTLFRSRDRTRARGGGRVMAPLPSESDRLLQRIRALVVELRRLEQERADRRELLRRRRDRKSTRLNSSHVAISYAVFCLKKKKQEHRTQ